MNSSLEAEEKVWTLELWISYLLRGGVLLCGAVIALGLALSAWKSSAAGTAGLSEVLQQAFSGKEVDISAIPLASQDLLQRLMNFDPIGVMTLGLRILILLPIFRVFFTFLIFLTQKDFIFVLMSGLVLVFLGIGFFGGAAL
jgi:uncharacterized membrane protein